MHVGEHALRDPAAEHGAQERREERCVRPAVAGVLAGDLGQPAVAQVAKHPCLATATGDVALVVHLLDQRLAVLLGGDDGELVPVGRGEHADVVVVVSADAGLQLELDLGQLRSALRELLEVADLTVQLVVLAEVQGAHLDHLEQAPAEAVTAVHLADGRARVANDERGGTSLLVLSDDDRRLEVPLDLHMSVSSSQPSGCRWWFPPHLISKHSLENLMKKEIAPANLQKLSPFSFDVAM